MNYINSALAQDPFSDALNEVNTSTGTVTAYKDKGDLATTIGSTIQIILGIIGLLLIINILYAGVTWTFAMGETDKIDKAKSLIKYSIVGLAVILIAYGLTGYIISQLTKI